MVLEVGDSAPVFSGASLHDLNYDFNGKSDKALLIFFYPKDNTPGCTVEAKEFSDLKDEFMAKNIELLGISPDNINLHKNFTAKHNLTVNLFSDLDSKVCDLYGVWKQKSMFGKKYMGVERTSFLIGSNGNILNIWRKVKPIGHAREILDSV